MRLLQNFFFLFALLAIAISISFLEKRLAIAATMISILIIFVYLKKTQVKRAKFWQWYFPSKFKHAFKFTFFYGLPIAGTLSYVLYDISKPIYLAIFIVLPVLFMFCWTGIKDWHVLRKILVEDKYNINL